jgi:16S rRNA (adenine1518-N6/adenine1519-N6)-dimethyltransferase
MNRVPPVHAVELLKQYGLRATKSLGQNFLDDPDALRLVAAAAEIRSSDTVLEIGPGLGSLTRYLAEQAHEVVAVELDPKFIPVLRQTLRLYHNTRIVLGDILALTSEELALPDRYIVAANIPYNITSGLVRHLLTSKRMPTRMVLTVQKEVAQRICALPPDMSLLSLSVQVYGEPRIVGQIPAEAFYPVPNVDSAIVRIEIYKTPKMPSELLPTFFQVAKAGFSQKRKTLRNSLSAGMRITREEAADLLLKTGIDPIRRAETLDLGEWEKLSQAWEKGLVSRQGRAKNDGDDGKYKVMS